MPGTALRAVLRTAHFQHGEKVIVMPPIESAKRWKITAMRLAVLIVIVLQTLGVEVGWTQEPVQPGIDDQFAKQEKIYRIRGANVPGSYITNRGVVGLCGGSSHRLLRRARQSR
jgi:hypothetical protein